MAVDRTGTNDPITQRPRELAADVETFNAAVTPALDKKADDGEVDDGTLLRLVQEGVSQSNSYITQRRRAAWERTIKSFRNEHFDGSKYLHKTHANRSRFFRPKTRTSVYKDLAGIGSAMFSTRDAIIVSAVDETDKNQKANAALNMELVNYRLDRNAGKDGVPWFMVAMGARLDAVLMGLCCSKQYWRYETREAVRQVPQQKTEPLIDPATGQPVIGDDGTPALLITEELVDESYDDVIEDRPMIDVVPMENVRFAPNADWRDIAQTSSYLIVMHPMHVGEVEVMMKRKSKREGGFKWREVDPAIIRSHGARAQGEVEGTRRARESGTDRLNDTAAQGGQRNEWAVVWVHENCVRYQGEDWHFWTLGTDVILSEPIPMRDAYPEQLGDRPYTIGVGNIESHNPYPMAPAESWQQMQQEINDLANQRMDNIKQNMAPLNKVLRGKNVDIQQLFNRSVNNVLYVNDHNDVTFDRPPDVTRSAYVEMQHLNADFDDLAGAFNNGSVQTNRSLNETVGGMRMIQNNANAMAEFYARVWAESWLERCLGQFLRLERYYEDDEKVLSVCGNRAGLLQRFNMSEISNELLDAQVRVASNIGLGSADPMSRFQKLGMAIDLAGKVAQGLPLLAQMGAKVDPEAIFDEIFGLAGYNDGGKRFMRFEPGQGVAPPPPEGGGGQPMDPQMGAAEMMRAQAEGDIGQKRLMLDAHNAEKDRGADLQKEQMRNMTVLLKQLLANQAAAEREGRRASERAYDKQVQRIDDANSQNLFTDGSYGGAS